MHVRIMQGPGARTSLRDKTHRRRLAATRRDVETCTAVSILEARRGLRAPVPDESTNNKCDGSLCTNAKTKVYSQKETR